MPWWLLGYVMKKPADGATTVVVLGPYTSEAEALSRRAEWLALSEAHQATTPWHANLADGGR